jgi:hypothetical protein
MCGISYARRAFKEPGLSHRMRDAVFGAVLTDLPESVDTDALPAAARQLRAQLAVSGTDALEPAEVALLGRWLVRLVR